MFLDLFQSKHKEEPCDNQIDCNNIDSFVENEENGRLILIYYLPAEPSRFSRYAEGDMVKHTDQFECAENTEIIKTFNGIRN